MQGHLCLLGFESHAVLTNTLHFKLQILSIKIESENNCWTKMTQMIKCYSSAGIHCTFPKQKIIHIHMYLCMYVLMYICTCVYMHMLCLLWFVNILLTSPNTGVARLGGTDMENLATYLNKNKSIITEHL